MIVFWSGRCSFLDFVFGFFLYHVRLAISFLFPPFDLRLFLLAESRVRASLLFPKDLPSLDHYRVLFSYHMITTIGCIILIIRYIINIIECPEKDIELLKKVILMCVFISP